MLSAEILKKEDEYLEWLLFEEFDSSLGFLHENSTEALYEAGLINKEFAKLANSFRDDANFLLGSENERLASFVRSNPLWLKLLT